MSFNNGGPWGQNGPNNAGPNNNGGKKPAGPTPQEIEIDRWIRAKQAQLRSVFPPPRGGGRNPFLRIALVVFAALWLGSGFYQVSSNQLGVVLRFGEVVRMEQPGLRYHLPEPIEMVLLPDVTSTHQLKIGFRDRSGESTDVADESRMLTGDENLVDIDFSVFWRVSDPRDFLFNIRNPELTIKLVAESAIREIVGRNEVQPILTDKREMVMRETADLIQKILDEYKSGIKVVNVQLSGVTVPQPVSEAFNDVQRALSDAVTRQNEAEAYRNEIIPRAKGDAVKMIQESEGYREQVVSIAKGEAARFESVLKGYNAGREVTATRIYLETMEGVLKNANKMVIDSGVKASGAVPYLPLPSLNTNK